MTAALSFHNQVPVTLLLLEPLYLPLDYICPSTPVPRSATAVN
jgi:hypothetical protein